MACLVFALAARGAELQPRSYAWLLSHATVVAAGTVQGVSSGMFSDGRSATVSVDGIIKGKLRARELRVEWNDKEFEETAWKSGARVVVFAVMRKDSTYGLAAPGISCWPVERVDIKGKASRAVEYAYPLDLLTGVPAAAMRTTETVEKSMNFQVAKRKQWILVDALLPPIRPLVLAKPAPARAPKRVVKSRPSAPKSRKLALSK
jgi:hypothetical protein